MSGSQQQGFIVRLLSGAIALFAKTNFFALLPTEIAVQIIREEGDYILALKGNQGNLHKGVKTFFEQAIAKDWEDIDYSYEETTEAGHHRIEHRQVWVVPISQVPNLPNRKKWKGLASLVRVRRRRLLWNTETDQVCN